MHHPGGYAFMAYTVLRLPISGTVAWVVAVSLLYVVLSLSLASGSTLARTQGIGIDSVGSSVHAPVLLLSGHDISH